MNAAEAEVPKPCVVLTHWYIKLILLGWSQFSYSSESVLIMCCCMGKRAHRLRWSGQSRIRKACCKYALTWEMRRNASHLRVLPSICFRCQLKSSSR